MVGFAGSRLIWMKVYRLLLFCRDFPDSADLDLCVFAWGHIPGFLRSSFSIRRERRTHPVRCNRDLYF